MSLEESACRMAMRQHNCLHCWWSLTKIAADRVSTSIIRFWDLQPILGRFEILLCVPGTCVCTLMYGTIQGHADEWLAVSVFKNMFLCLPPGHWRAANKICKSQYVEFDLKPE